MIFINIGDQEEKEAQGIRVQADAANERVWMHGKWLELGPDHAVAWIDGPARFVTAAGRALLLGQFPAWSVRGKGKKPCAAIMFNVSQFVGGKIVIGNKSFSV